MRAGRKSSGRASRALSDGIIVKEKQASLSKRRAGPLFFWGSCLWKVEAA